MNSRIAKALFIASFAAASVTANAQYTSPNSPTDTSATKGGMARSLPENDIRAYREGRRACNKMDGAAKEDCRKKLSAKYVDKQCRNLTDTKLDDCMKAEYPGD